MLILQIISFKANCQRTLFVCLNETVREYDPAGHLKKLTDSAGLITRYEYPDGLATKIIIRPGGATEITTRYKDGRMKSISGTGVIPCYYEYGVENSGRQRTKIYIGSDSSLMWEKTVTGMLGRTVRTEKPGYEGVIVTTENKRPAETHKAEPARK